jgi:peroxiredoxin
MHPASHASLVLLATLACTPRSSASASNQPQVGESAPALVATSLAGEPLDLAASQGKVVIVDFWATWCEPCRQELPELVTLHRELGPEGLVVIAVSVDDERASIDTFLTELPLPFAIVHDHDDALAEVWSPPTMPTSYVIDRRGKVAHVHPGYRHGDAEQLRDEIEVLLATP